VVGGDIGGKHDVHGDGVSLSALNPFPVAILFLEREKLKGIDIRAGHDNPVRIPFHDGLTEDGHFAADGGGVRLDGAQSRIISKGEFEVDSGLLLLKDDLDGHSVESIVKGVIRFPVVHIRFRAPTKKLNLLNAREGVLHEAQGLSCVGVILSRPLSGFAIQVGGKAVV